MRAKHFQVSSEGHRLQTVIELPETGDVWPIVVVNHGGIEPRDRDLFAELAERLNPNGVAVCRFDPRGYTKGLGAPQPPSFWNRWMDLFSVMQHLAQDDRFSALGLAGAGMGSLLSLWWAKIHSIESAVCLGLPPEHDVGSLPRAIENTLPLMEAGSLLPYPTGVANTLLLFGSRDRQAARAPEIAERMRVAFHIVGGGDRHFSQSRARAAALDVAAEWHLAHLPQTGPEAPHHTMGTIEAEEGIQPRR